MFIGVDIGTTNIKAAAFETNSRLCAVFDCKNHSISPEPGRHEQDPEALFRKVLVTLKGILTHPELQDKTINGIIFSSALHGFMAQDESGAPLSRLWLWSDLRATEQANMLRNRHPDIYKQTGVPIHPMSPLCKVLWMKQHQAAEFKQAARFLDIKGYVWHRLTGRFECDLGCASGTGFLNIQNRQWDPTALALAGIQAEQLPEPVVPLTSSVYTGSDSALRKLLKQTPLYIGSSDGALANLGSGADKPGHTAVTIGTSAAIRSLMSQPVLDEQMRTFCYFADDHRYIVGGASNNGTNALEWLRQSILKSRLKADAFIHEALEAPPGADGLIFTPYLAGERAPIWNPQAMAGFQGLTSRHTRAHLIRATLEGILFNLKLISNALPSPIDMMHASGGFSKSPAWVQMLADIFQKPVQLNAPGADASVLGAVRLLDPQLETAQQHTTIVQPNLQNAVIYERSFQLFQEQLANSAQFHF